MDSSKSAVTIANAIMEAVGTLGQAGVESPRLDAEVLMAFLLATDRLHIMLEADRHLSDRELADYRALIAERAQRIPLAYLTGERDFYGLSFKIAPGVLVPRPETELLVEVAMAPLQSRPGVARILEVGSGSGCVAVSLARTLPNAELTALDRDAVALRLTEENARLHNVQSQIRIAPVDFIQFVAPAPHIYDAIVSNPPYIPSGEIDSLQPEVAQYEPRGALDGGPDGLDFIRILIARAREMLAPGGFLAMEVGAGEAEAVAELGKAAGYARTRIHPDLAGIPRVVLMAMDTCVLRIDPDVPDLKAIAEAVSTLRRHEPVAFPTETVYGLGVRGTDEVAVGRIYEAKGRDEGKPIALLVSDPAQAEMLAREVPLAAKRLMKEYFPGPLTIILEAGEGVPRAVTAGTGKVGIRMPDHPLALALIRRVGEPLATTSANRSGGPEPKSGQDVLDQLGGRIELLLDGGPTGVGVPSTVVDLTESPFKILRQGAIPRERIEEIVQSK